MKKRVISFALIILTLVSVFGYMPKVEASTSYSVYTLKYTCAVRTKPDENSLPIMNGNDPVQVKPNQQVEYLSSKTGPNNGLQNQTWYAVKLDYAAREYTGYVAKACFNEVKTYTYSDEAEFESSISSFPNSYKPYLRKLHAIHPNWTFVADQTGLDWGTAVTAESQKGTSAISKLYPSLFFRDSTNPDGIIVDGTSWYAPCYDAVAYYMDPRNFLTEKNLFMFENLSYNAIQDSSVQGILNGSFMSGSFTEDGYTKTYAQAFIDAAKESGVSSTHLASRALQEMGTTLSSAASGTVAGYEGYYNFYNIGATSGADNYLKGLARAKQEGWNSRQKSITGGAWFIGNGYINKGQATLYFQKYNVASDRKFNAYTHQYMTNIMAPVSESSSIYESYKNNNKLANAYVFKIPVYTSMTSNAYKVSRTDTVGGNETTNGDASENTPDSSQKPVVSPETKISNAGYSLSTGYLTGITAGSDMSTLRGNLSNNGASVATLNSSWNSKTSGVVSTGDIIEVDGSKRFEAVIYGDVSGDGEISIKDLLLVKKHLLGDSPLKGAFKAAADVSKESDVSIKDLLLIKKHLLKEYTINQ